MTQQGKPRPTLLRYCRNRLTIGSEDEPPKPFDNFIVNWECQSVDQGRTGDFTGSGGVSCSSLGGSATIIWDYLYPNPRDEYYISKETNTGDGSCGSYNTNNTGGIVGSTFQGNRPCAFGVEITITHISGESIVLDMRSRSSPSL